MSYLLVLNAGEKDGRHADSIDGVAPSRLLKWSRCSDLEAKRIQKDHQY